MSTTKKEEESVDYTLSNPDTLTKYKSAAAISQKVLEEVTKLCVAGEKIVTICEKGDKILDEEIAKVYRGKKVSKGPAHPTTVSPSSFVTPYTPLNSDEAEAAVTIKEGEAIKIQLGAQIDGFGTIVCDTIIVPSADNKDGAIHGRDADLLLATHYANELLLRLMVPPGLLATGTDEEKEKASKVKAPTQSKITSLLEKVVKSYDCNLVEHTTSWLFSHNEIEDKKRIILSPGEGNKGEGIPDVGEVWGVEMGVSLGSGKTKNLECRATLHRRTLLTYALKRPSSKKILNEVVKKFGVFPFSLRQLEDERDAKVGVVECVRGNVFRQYEVIGEKDAEPVGRLLTTIAITKNGIQKLAAPPAPDLSKFKTDKKITDEEILKILEQPLAKDVKSKPKKAKKKKAKKPAATAATAEDDDDDTDDDE
ncbi:Curved DNA-binding [Hyphodiscus hymeniophilus]|uniref:Curved DNA-binding n=1 Tax=Hyphodiscus hymeniophilus TaxID=353542 RepID=A0A9P6VGS5_9HELO|nr:Curved DNA-binding [Hyphodiscus hymeniophilus]